MSMNTDISDTIEQYTFFSGFTPKYSDTSYQTVTKQYYTLFSEFILKNSDTFREILPYNITHFFKSTYQKILTILES